jgi:hypothetical protein
MVITTEGSGVVASGQPKSEETLTPEQLEKLRTQPEPGQPGSLSSPEPAQLQQDELRPPVVRIYDKWDAVILGLKECSPPPWTITGDAENGGSITAGEETLPTTIEVDVRGGYKITGPLARPFANHRGLVLAGDEAYNIEPGLAEGQEATPPPYNVAPSSTYGPSPSVVTEPPPPDETPVPPDPTLSGISPTTAVAGGADETLTATGMDFTATSVISFNGVALTTTFVDPTSLTATIPVSAAVAGTVPVLVQTDGKSTSPIDFTFTAA